jgi:metal-responsive CopG/Arc/MetJ family transcriptional regulator
MSAMVRTHLLLPKELLDQLDEKVGARRRSETIARLLEEYLRREQLPVEIACFGGSMNPEDYPEWATRESIAEWVRNERRASDRSSLEPLGG